MANVDGLESELLGDLDGLSPEAKTIALRVLDELASQAGSQSMSVLWEADYKREPPTIAQFLEDDFYMGRVCRADPESGSPGLFPKWRERLLEDLAPNSPVRQVLLSGSIGLGKSWVGVLMLLFYACRVMCMHDPLRFFALAKASSLTFSFFSVTQKQVYGGAYLDCIKMMRESPFFRENVLPTTPLDGKNVGRRIELSNDVVIEAGSQVHEALGRNVLVSLIDEINFRLEANAASAAKDLVEAIRRRFRSRFANRPGLLIIISSAKEDSDFLSTYIRQYRSDPTVRVYEYAWWEVAGAVKMNYCGKRFYVDIGTSIVPPSILDGDEELAKIPPSRVLSVPVEHREEFDNDLTGSIRDLGGKSTGRTSKLFPNELVLLNGLSDDIPNPFPSTTIPLSVNSVTAIHEHLISNTLVRFNGSRMLPCVHPGSPRYIHLDMSTGAQDAMGFVMVHPTGNVRVNRVEGITGQFQHEFAPIFQVDLAFRIVRSTGESEIDFGKVRQFIWWLREVGFNIRIVGCDLYHLSAEMRSILARAGFNTVYQSVDRKKDAYIALKQAFVEGRVKYYDNDWLYAELANLNDYPDKVDHPERFPPVLMNGEMVHDLKASKDVADGLAGAINLATSDKDEYDNDGDFRSTSAVMAEMRKKQGDTVEDFRLEIKEKVF